MKQSVKVLITIALIVLVIKLILYFISNRNNSTVISTEQSTSAPPRQLKIFDWNVAGLPLLFDVQGIKTPVKVNKFSNPNNRVDGILSTILSYDPDIICLQEVFDAKFGKKIKYTLEQNGYQVIWLRSKKFLDKVSCGLLTATKFEFAGHQFKSYTSTYGEDGAANKGFLYTRIKLNDETYISLINTHLQATSIYNTSSLLKLLYIKTLNIKVDKQSNKSKSNATKQNQLTELMQYIKRLSGIDNLMNDTFIITGDFNSTQKAERLISFNKDIAKITENDISTLDSQEIKTCCNGNFKIQYDHMFIFNKKYQLPNISFSTIEEEDFNLSDHKPLIALTN